jgi:hypothetical protein
MCMVCIRCQICIYLRERQDVALEALVEAQQVKQSIILTVLDN